MVPWGRPPPGAPCQAAGPWHRRRQERAVPSPVRARVLPRCHTPAVLPTPRSGPGVRGPGSPSSGARSTWRPGMPAGPSPTPPPPLARSHQAAPVPAALPLRPRSPPRLPGVPARSAGQSRGGDSEGLGGAKPTSPNLTQRSVGRGASRGLSPSCAFQSVRERPWRGARAPPCTRTPTVRTRPCAPLPIEHKPEMPPRSPGVLPFGTGPTRKPAMR